MAAGEIAGLVVAIIICELVGGLGSLVTVREIPGWYATLRKPPLNPPSWLFGPVWTTLYALMGVAAYLVWHAGIARADVRLALAVFALQLLLNGAWSYLFFGRHSPALGALDITLLWLAILATLIVFAGIAPWAAALLVPYLLWVTFAAYLNFALWRLN